MMMHAPDAGRHRSYSVMLMVSLRPLALALYHSRALLSYRAARAVQSSSLEKSSHLLLFAVLAVNSPPPPPPPASSYGHPRSLRSTSLSLCPAEASHSLSALRNCHLSALRYRGVMSATVSDAGPKPVPSTTAKSLGMRKNGMHCPDHHGSIRSL